MSDDRKFPTEIIDLPSKGWFYDKDNPFSSGQVEMKYMTAKEEDILTSRNLIAKGNTIDKLLQELIVTPDADYNTLVVGDKNGIMIAARVLAYGKEYPISATCSVCRTRQQVSVDLTALDEKKIKKPKTLHTNEFTFELPLSKKVLTFKLLTHKDEMEIDRELRKLEELKLDDPDIDRSLSTRLKHIITAVDGDSSMSVVRNFVDNEFLAREARSFRKYYAEITPDVEMKYPFKCSNLECVNEGEVRVPIGPDFFWPDFEI